MAFFCIKYRVGSLAHTHTQYPSIAPPFLISVYGGSSIFHQKLLLNFLQLLDSLSSYAVLFVLFSINIFLSSFLFLSLNLFILLSLYPPFSFFLSISFFFFLCTLLSLFFSQSLFLLHSLFLFVSPFFNFSLPNFYPSLSLFSTLISVLFSINLLSPPLSDHSILLSLPPSLSFFFLFRFISVSPLFCPSLSVSINPSFFLYFFPSSLHFIHLHVSFFLTTHPFLLFSLCFYFFLSLCPLSFCLLYYTYSVSLGIMDWLKICESSFSMYLFKI